MNYLANIIDPVELQWKMTNTIKKIKSMHETKYIKNNFMLSTTEKEKKSNLKWTFIYLLYHLKNKMKCCVIFNSILNVFYYTFNITYFLYWEKMRI